MVTGVLEENRSMHGTKADHHRQVKRDKRRWSCVCCSWGLVDMVQVLRRTHRGRPRWQPAATCSSVLKGGGARDRSDWRVIHKGSGGFNRGEGHDVRAELPRGHPWRSELGHGADGIRWFGPMVGRRGTGVDEGFLPGRASEAEASRRAGSRGASRPIAPALARHGRQYGRGKKKGKHGE
jgi:hypothetical protein